MTPRNYHIRALPLLVFASLVHAGWEPIEAVCSAYCPCNLCTPGKGVTANGTKTANVPYGIAVAPGSEGQIPMGSVLWVPAGYGYLDISRADSRAFVVDDRMARRIGRGSQTPRIDLRYRTHESAVKFGVKRITIYIWREESK